MKKKKVVIHFGNLIIVLLVIAILGVGVYYMYNKLNDKSDTPSINNGNSVKDSKVIKKLTDLGYSKSDAEEISTNLEEEIINKIDKKYNNLVEYSKIKYFHIENIDRYDKLMEDENYDVEEVIMRVNTSIDKDFYSDIETVNNVDDLLVLVNKYYALPEDYKPKDLITVDGEQMQRVAGEALEKMLDDIKETGLHLQAQSGYRSLSTQKRLYDNRVASEGVEAADRVQARPGHSEHHTGLAIDVSHDGTLEESFDQTEQFTWLKENAHKYGFILRYPKDKVYMTGYDYEPWHYRYVGVEIATLIHTEGITFEEYYVKYKGLY